MISITINGQKKSLTDFISTKPSRFKKVRKVESNYGAKIMIKASSRYRMDALKKIHNKYGNDFFTFAQLKKEYPEIDMSLFRVLITNNFILRSVFNLDNHQWRLNPSVIRVITEGDVK